MNRAIPSLPHTSWRGAKLIQHRDNFIIISFVGGLDGQGDVVRMGGLRSSLLWNINGKKSQERPRGRWEDNIKIYLEEDVRVWTGYL
jgi:hypothetical protein